MLSSFHWEASAGRTKPCKSRIADRLPYLIHDGAHLLRTGESSRLNTLLRAVSKHTQEQQEKSMHALSEMLTQTEK